jgi:hypothetical protein
MKIENFFVMRAEISDLIVCWSRRQKVEEEEFEKRVHGVEIDYMNGLIWKHSRKTPSN